jgi:hypothetical protein
VKPPGTRAQSGLNAELDAAFAAVQAAIDHPSGSAEARKSARDRVARASTMVKLALEESTRSEAEKRLLEAKLRALVGAAARIPAP